MPSLKVILLTGRTLRQGQGKEYGKLSERYWKSVAICEIDPDDMKKLGITEGNSVKIGTDYGSVIVRAVKSLRGPHAGRVFIPYGPWANVIINPKTHGTGMPSFKGVQATIERALSKEEVLTMPELLQRHFKKEQT
jgi:formylmethanofuran dehydrogenase subunit D